MKPTIEQDFPAADTVYLLPAAMLTRAYNDLRERAIRLEAASLRVAGLENRDTIGIGPVMLAKIVQEAKDALK